MRCPAALGRMSWPVALGNDTYYVDNVGDVVTENASEGTDTVHANFSYILAANVEQLFLEESSRGGDRRRQR